MHESDNLTITERGVAASLVEDWPKSPPPNLARVIKHAPDSFRDQRLGRIVEAGRTLASEGKPVYSITIMQALGDFPEAKAEVSGFTGGDVVPIEGAEDLARDVWHAFEAQRLGDALDEGRHQLLRFPDKSPHIARNLGDLLTSYASEASSFGIAARLDARRFNFQHQPEEPEPVFLVGDVPISTPGNLTAVSAYIKAGKSAWLGAMMAAAMAERDGDFLGLRARPLGDLALVHFDTEQSPFDHDQLIRRALRRADLDELPPGLRSFCLTGWPHDEIRDAIRFELYRAANEFGGVHSGLIDGIGDCVADVNDPEESNAFVAELHALGIKYAAPILGVIHLNPGSSKTRGHLGSQFERKAESNLVLEKDAEEVTTVWADKNRRAPIPKAFGPRFAFSRDAGMHVSVATVRETREDAKRTELRHLAEAVLEEAGKPCLAWKEFRQGVQSVAGLKESAADKRFENMRKHAVVVKNRLGQWALAA